VSRFYVSSLARRRHILFASSTCLSGDSMTFHFKFTGHKKGRAARAAARAAANPMLLLSTNLTSFRSLGFTIIIGTSLSSSTYVETANPLQQRKRGWPDSAVNQRLRIWNLIVYPSTSRNQLHARRYGAPHLQPHASELAQ
jgi:hypothetical protein